MVKTLFVIRDKDTKEIIRGKSKSQNAYTSKGRALRALREYKLHSEYYEVVELVPEGETK